MLSNRSRFKLTETNESGDLYKPVDFQFQFPYEYWIPFVQSPIWTSKYFLIYAPDQHNLMEVSGRNSGRSLDQSSRGTITENRTEIVMVIRDISRNPEDRFSALLRLLFQTSFDSLQGPKMKLLLSIKEEYRSFKFDFGSSLREKSAGPASQSDLETDGKHLWSDYLEHPINGKTMAQRINEIEIQINQDDMQK